MAETEEHRKSSLANKARTVLSDDRLKQAAAVTKTAARKKRVMMKATSRTREMPANGRRTYCRGGVSRMQHYFSVIR